MSIVFLHFELTNYFCHTLLSLVEDYISGYGFSHFDKLLSLLGSFSGMLLLLLSHFSHVWLCTTPSTAAHQASLSLGFSRQEHRSGLPFPSPMHESEKWKWSRSVVSDLQRPHGLQPSKFLHPWDFPGKSTGVGCHCRLSFSGILAIKLTFLFLICLIFVRT